MQTNNSRPARLARTSALLAHSAHTCGNKGEADAAALRSGELCAKADMSLSEVYMMADWSQAPTVWATIATAYRTARQEPAYAPLA